MAISAMSESEWESISHDWITEETFTLPESMSCVVLTREAHETAVLMAVCKRCHLQNAKERRRKSAAKGASQ